MTDVTIQLSEAAAIELAAALDAPPPEPIVLPETIRANITVSGGVLTATKNEGFSEISRQGVGIIKFVLDPPMPDANYIVLPAGTCGSSVPAFRVIINSASIFSVTCFLNGVVTDPLSLQVKVEP